MTGGFTPRFGGEAQDMSVVGGVRGFTDAGFNWDASVAVGAHQTDLFIRDTVNASLGDDTPTAFDLGRNRQREIGALLHEDLRVGRFGPPFSSPQEPHLQG